MVEVVGEHHDHQSGAIVPVPAIPQEQIEYLRTRLP
jgi:hypothetical protein